MASCVFEAFPLKIDQVTNHRENQLSYITPDRRWHKGEGVGTTTDERIPKKRARVVQISWNPPVQDRSCEFPAVADPASPF